MPKYVRSAKGRMVDMEVLRNGDRVIDTGQPEIEVFEPETPDVEQAKPSGHTPSAPVEEKSSPKPKTVTKKSFSSTGKPVSKDTGKTNDPISPKEVED